VVNGNTAFALDLYAHVRDRPGNQFFSPYNLSTALAMTYAGARGQTAQEMAHTLHFPTDQKALHAALAAVNGELLAGRKLKGCQLYTANALWGQKGVSFLPDFLQTLRQFYGAGLREVDFREATEEARRTINAWVEKQTRDKIKDLFPPGVLTSDTELALTSAIYFKGDWASPFRKDRTQTGDFHVAADRKVSVPLMHQTASFGFFEDDQIKVLEMPYAGDTLSLVALLPKKVDGLADFERKLTPDRLVGSLRHLQSQEVEVTFPRFRATAEYRLKDILSAMGMPSAFSPKADFTGMTGQPGLYLSAVIHKAYVDLNEEGTEAAAATGIAAKLAAVARMPTFRADHSFVYLIRDRQTGTILFLGRVTDPAAQES
jgi:serpin B